MNNPQNVGLRKTMNYVIKFLNFGVTLYSNI